MRPQIAEKFFQPQIDPVPPFLAEAWRLDDGTVECQ
jgi:hypothetical protein